LIIKRRRCSGRSLLAPRLRRRPACRQGQTRRDERVRRGPLHAEPPTMILLEARTLSLSESACQVTGRRSCGRRGVRRRASSEERLAFVVAKLRLELGPWRWRAHKRRPVTLLVVGV